MFYRKQMRYMRLLVVLFYCVLSLQLICSCAHKDNEKEEPKTAEELYREASLMLTKKEYKKSAELFSQVVYQYPYYEGASKAQLMEIYAYYLLKDYDSVIPAVENYIKMHPASPHIDYAYYIKSLSYYVQIDTPHRDQSITRDAKAAFIELRARFPKSEYAKDAKVKLELMDDHLAAQEMIIGRYYLKKGHILAAINRFKVILDKYSTTSHIEEALYRLTEAYIFLELQDEAKQYASVLGHNYPESKWYKESYQLLTQKY